MKRKILQQICASHNKELHSQFDKLKSNYQYLFKFEDLFDNFSIGTKAILKTIIKASNIHNGTKDILINLLEEEAKDPIIIGITGTVGKTSTAYLLTQYIKALGKKVTLLSSASLDLPISRITKDICMPVPIQSNNYLKNFLQLSLDYNSDYIIIEVSEEALRDNKVQNIPFDIKVLTHFWHNWMEEELPNERYLENKSSFFTNEEDVKYFYHVSSENLSHFINKANNPILYGSRYNSNGITADNIQYRIKEFFATFKKQYIEIQTPKEVVTLRTTSIYNFASVQNVCGVISILDYLGILNTSLLEETLNKTEIPGRKIINVNNRTIIITQSYLNDIFLFKELLDNEMNTESLEKLGEIYTNEYNNIIVIDGITGWSPIWDNAAPSEEYFLNDLYNNYPTYYKSKAEAFPIVDRYYITNVNPGTCDKDKLLNFVEQVLKESGKPLIKISNRKECLRQVILDSQPGDVIFISGRASFDIYQDGNNTLFFTDEEVIRKFLEDLKWL